MALTLESTAFTAGQTLDVRFTCDGDDVSPPLAWHGLPPETKSLAVVLADPDAPRGTFYHWAIFDVPPDRAGLDQGVATEEAVDGMRQGVNDFGRVGYSGSCPPKGNQPHHYRFRLFALKVAKLDLRDRPKAAEVERRAQAEALATADLVVLYGR
jgi:Raf kinase inhibitor-like YbhB/YbcL family protein